MNLNTLQPAKGSVQSRKRIGRGQGSGRGGTSTRGHKGARSRSGYSRKAGFEGGQMPLSRRLPKYGFKNINRIEYAHVNLDTLQKLADEKGINEVNPQVLISNGIITDKYPLKVLGRGELKSKLNVTAHKFSESAAKAIESSGGQINTL